MRGKTLKKMSQQTLSKGKELSKRDLFSKSFLLSWILIGLLSLGRLAFTQLPKMAAILEGVVINSVEVISSPDNTVSDR